MAYGEIDFIRKMQRLSDVSRSDIIGAKWITFGDLMYDDTTRGNLILDNSAHSNSTRNNSIRDNSTRGN